MGCDIHCYAEIRGAKTGDWEKVGDKFTGLDNAISDRVFDFRNHNMFYLFAGVRGTMIIDPISYPKGLPNDVTAEVKALHDEYTDIHSVSWLSLKELKSFRYGKKYTKLLPELYFINLAELSLLGDDVRIVFWFDS